MRFLLTGMLITLFAVIYFDTIPAQNQDADELENTITIRKTELENIQKELEDKQSNLSSLESTEKDYIEQLYSVEEQLNLNNRFLNKIKRQLADINRFIADLEIKLKTTEEDLIRREEILSERLVWIYKRSKVSPLLTALSAESLLDGARRLYMFSLLNRYDRKMIEEIEKLKLQVKTERANLIQKKNSINPLKREHEQQVNTNRKNRSKRKQLLEEVQNRKDIEIKAIHQLEEDQSRISGIIDVLLQNQSLMDKEAAKAFLSLKGKLVWPVQGKIIRRFGKIKDNRYNTVISSPGIDIKASAGTPVYAASTGEVAYISWLRGYGSFVIIDHGGGYYTLYAHLDDILVDTGQFITAGETLAIVGETGAFTGPILHFELRFGKEQLDPVPWLR